jgi:hypothetical protein
MANKIWARVVDGVVMEIVTLSDTIAITDAFHADVAAQFVDATAASPSAAQGMLYQNGGFVPAGVRAPTWPERRMQAQGLLDQSDVTILRCAENGVAVPTVWKTYRAALRAIAAASTGDPTVQMPSRPAFPTGT